MKSGIYKFYSYPKENSKKKKNKSISLNKDCINKNDNQKKNNKHKLPNDISKSFEPNKSKQKKDKLITDTNDNLTKIMKLSENEKKLFLDNFENYITDIIDYTIINDNIINNQSKNKKKR